MSLLPTPQCNEKQTVCSCATEGQFSPWPPGDEGDPQQLPAQGKEALQGVADAVLLLILHIDLEQKISVLSIDENLL